jgi:hypothetical protein
MIMIMTMLWYAHANDNYNASDNANANDNDIVNANDNASLNMWMSIYDCVMVL